MDFKVVSRLISCGGGVALLTRWTEDVWDANYRGLVRHAVILCQPGSVVLN